MPSTGLAGISAVVPVGTIIAPVLATCSAAWGLAVPIPMLPFELKVIRSVLFVRRLKLLSVVVPTKRDPPVSATLPAKLIPVTVTLLAVKPPDASRATMAPASFALVAVVRSLERTPHVKAPAFRAVKLEPEPTNRVAVTVPALDTVTFESKASQLEVLSQ